MSKKILSSLFILFLIARDFNNFIKAILDFDMREWTSWLAIVIVSVIYFFFYPILIYTIWKKENKNE